MDKLPISIIIPTYNEEKYLPRLLQSIKNQEFQPSEVIIADSPRTNDKTREIAERFGYKVVKGGTVSQGRNRGASHATQPVLVFIDADAFLTDPYTLCEAYIQFQKGKFDIVSSRSRLDEEAQTHISSKFADKTNTMIKKVSTINPKFNIQGGWFVAVKKDVFSNLGGFREDLKNAEDIELFRRAEKLGYKYTVLPLDITLSGRRFDTPKKLINSAIAGVIMGIALWFGIKKLSEVSQKAAKIYGKLGGSENSNE
ncbi:glycosyltransferase [Candidatus Dojkabacteria bacterium]|nr:glycosyltransferase [Candidatus Dojkabacteria bacterium]